MAHAGVPVNARQRKAVNTLLDQGPGGFEGGMSTRKYVSLTSTSRPTPSRELIELNALGVLKQSGAGRSTRYYINLPGWTPKQQGPRRRAFGYEECMSRDGPMQVANGFMGAFSATRARRHA